MNRKSIVSAIRDNKNDKKTKRSSDCLEFYAPRKFIVEPAEHRQLDTGLKIDLPEDFTTIFSVISENIIPENCKNILNKKCLISNFLNTSFTKTYSIDKSNIVRMLIVTNKNNKPFEIRHFLS